MKKTILSPGWIDESTNCTSEFGTCQPKLCMNGGTCDGDRRCSCTEGYQGSASMFVELRIMLFKGLLSDCAKHIILIF